MWIGLKAPYCFCFKIFEIKVKLETYQVNLKRNAVKYLEQQVRAHLVTSDYWLSAVAHHYFYTHPCFLALSLSAS